jgi:hypothetical protein
VEGREEGKRSMKGRVRRQEEKMRAYYLLGSRFEVFELMPLNSLLLWSPDLKSKIEEKEKKEPKRRNKRENKKTCNQPTFFSLSFPSPTTFTVTSIQSL